MKVYQYKDDEEYRREQEAANKRKIKKVWVQKSTILEIKKRIPSASSILCHGTRNAAEQKFFREVYPEAEIVGTEISSTALDFPMTVQWDFRKGKPEWIERFDIVYSNSFDHTDEPEETLEVWKNQLKENGFLIIEYAFGKKDNKSRRSDPLEISSEEFSVLSIRKRLSLIEQFDIENRQQCKIFLYRISKTAIL